MDEADKLLQGNAFLTQIREIIKHEKIGYKILLYSATYPKSLSEKIEKVFK